MIKSYTILSVEDNMPDFTLLEKALRRIEDVNLNIINVTDGQDALDFVYKENKYKDAPTPDLIILDLNLPLITGHEVLKKLKEDENYRIIPIIIYSTSDSNIDVWTSYAMYANCYITKAYEISKVFSKIASMGEYWFKTAKLPNKKL